MTQQVFPVRQIPGGYEQFRALEKAQKDLARAEGILAATMESRDYLSCRVDETEAAQLAADEARASEEVARAERRVHRCGQRMYGSHYAAHLTLVATQEVLS